MAEESKKPGCMSRINKVVTFLAAIFGIIGTLLVIYQFVSGNTSLHIQLSTNPPPAVASPSPGVTPTATITSSPPASTSNPPVASKTPADIAFPYTLWTWFWWIFPGTIVILLSLPSRGKELAYGALGVLLLSLVGGLVVYFIVHLFTRTYTPSFLWSVGVVSVFCILYLIGVYVPDEKDAPAPNTNSAANG